MLARRGASSSEGVGAEGQEEARRGRGSVLAGEGAAQWHLSQDSRAGLMPTASVSHGPGLQAKLWQKAGPRASGKSSPAPRVGWGVGGGQGPLSPLEICFRGKGGGPSAEASQTPAPCPHQPSAPLEKPAGGMGCAQHPDSRLTSTLVPSYATFPPQPAHLKLHNVAGLLGKPGRKCTAAVRTVVSCI